MKETITRKKRTNEVNGRSSAWMNEKKRIHGGTREITMTEEKLKEETIARIQIIKMGDTN